MGQCRDTRHQHPRPTQGNLAPSTRPSEEGQPSRAEPPVATETGHGTQPRQRPPRHRPRHPRRRPPPLQTTASDQPPPEVWCTVLERGHNYVVSAAASDGPQWVIKGTNTMLAARTTPPRVRGEPATLHRVLRGVLQPGDQAPARALAQVTSGRAGYHLGLAMLCLLQWIKRRWSSTEAKPCIRKIPTAHRQVKAGPDTP